jgi:hypothetical protein
MEIGSKGWVTAVKRPRLPSVPTCWLLMPGTRAAEDIARHRPWGPCRSRGPLRAALAVLPNVRGSGASIGVPNMPPRRLMT